MCLSFRGKVQGQCLVVFNEAAAHTSSTSKGQLKNKREGAGKSKTTEKAERRCLYEIRRRVDVWFRTGSNGARQGKSVILREMACFVDVTLCVHVCCCGGGIGAVTPACYTVPAIWAL